MTLLTLIVGICVLLFALYLVRTFLPAPWQTPLLVIIVILALVWLATIFAPGITSLRVGR